MAEPLSRMHYAARTRFIERIKSGCSSIWTPTARPYQNFDRTIRGREGKEERDNAQIHIVSFPSNTGYSRAGIKASFLPDYSLEKVSRQNGSCIILETRDKLGTQIPRLHKVTML